MIFKLNKMKIFIKSIMILMIFFTYMFFLFYLDEELNMSLSLLNFMILPGILLSLFQKKFSYNKDENMMIPLFLIIWMLFMTKNIFLFFIFYEMSVIPIIMMVTSSGGSKKREEAGFFLLGYAMVSATLMMWSIFFLSKSGTSDFNNFFSNICKNEDAGSMHEMSSFFYGSFLKSSIFFLSTLTFLVKFPMFFFHVWLPKAHVEAPVYGSMVLASMLLKMSGSAFFSFLSVFQNIQLNLMVFLIFFSFFGGSIIGLICFNQKDSKILIALSSVQHMSLCIVGLFILNSHSLMGSLFVMVSHGFLSPILFFMSSISYEKMSLRSFFYSDSKSGKSFVFKLIWVFIVFSSMGFPPFLLFEGEIILMKISLSSFCFFLCFLLYFFLSGSYSVALLSSFIMRKDNEKMMLSEFSGSSVNSMLSSMMILLPFFLIYLNSSSFFFF